MNLKNKDVPKIILKKFFKIPKISICIPTLNRPKEFSKLLNYIIEEITPDIEIVILDDNTNNFSYVQFQKLTNLKEFQYQYFKGNPNGVDKANLFLLEKARGDFVWWFSDDDLILKNGLESVKNIIKKDPMISFIWVNFGHKTRDSLAYKSSSRYFIDAEDMLLTLGHNLGLMSTYVIKRKLALKYIEYGYKYVRGFAFAATAVVIKTVVEENKAYLLSGPYIMNYPSKLKDMKRSMINKEGVLKNEAFKTYGIYFKEIIDGCKPTFSRQGYIKIMRVVFKPVWKGLLVAWIGGWDNPVGKRLLIFKLYWYLPECWLAVALFCLPRKFSIMLFKIYKYKFR